MHAVHRIFYKMRVPLFYNIKALRVEFPGSQSQTYRYISKYFHVTKIAKYLVIMINAN